MDFNPAFAVQTITVEAQSDLESLQEQATLGLLPPVLALTQPFDLPDGTMPDTVSIARIDASSVVDPLLNTPQISAFADEQRQGFRIGNVGIMIGYEDGNELTEVPALYYLPYAPAWFMGMANLHGNMVPVFDLATYLGIETAPVQQETDEHIMLLVLGHGADAAGIVIDGIPQRLTWSSKDQSDPDTAPFLLLPHVRSACLIDGQLWFDMDCDSLLSALENSMKRN